MKKHIEEISQDYVESLYISLEEKTDAYTDFLAGINRVLQHPEEFGLQTKEYV